MGILRINLKKEVDDSYDIVIGSGLFNKLAAELKKSPLGSSYVIITDSNVARLYGKELLNNFSDKNIRAHLLTFAAGEKSKSRKTKEKIEDEMLKLALGRDTCIIALGGGVVGDLAGFVAATYMRGVPYIQVPTTLLAQIDSSIGGKVGLDTQYAKNSVGAFYQPKRVITDVNFLKTLPKKELMNGMAEIIKHALIKDKDFFYFLEKNMDKIFNIDSKILPIVIKKNCEIKSDIVSKDEKEKGLRKILNYGHTIGHAIESASSYSISHGEAVSIGMGYAANLSVNMGFLDEGSQARQNNLLESSGISPKLLNNKLNKRKILEYIKRDKKIINGKMQFVLLDSIGHAFIYDKITLEDIKNIL